MTRITTFFRHNAIALAALFISLGGTSYAAITIPRNSVGARQLRRGAVTSRKIHSGAITPGKLSSKYFGGRILYFAEIANNGSVLMSDPKGVKTENWTLSTNGGLVTFPRRIPKKCFAMAAAETPGAPDGEPLSVGAGIESNQTQVSVSANPATPVALEIICAR